MDSVGMGRESGATIMLCIRLFALCFPPPLPPPSPCPPFVLPLALPPPPPPPAAVLATFLAFSLPGVSLVLPDEDTAEDGVRPADLEDDPTRPLPPVARLLLDVADWSRRWRPPCPPSPARGPALLSLLLFPEGAAEDREPRE